MQVKKIFGTLLTVCFLMSVTAAVVCADANPVNNVNNPGLGNDFNKPGSLNNFYKPGLGNNVNNPGLRNDFNKPGSLNNFYKPEKKPFFKQTTHKKMYKPGYWGYKTVWHNKDKHHKNRWFTKERCYFPGYYY